MNFLSNSAFPCCLFSDSPSPVGTLSVFLALLIASAAVPKTVVNFETSSLSEYDLSFSNSPSFLMAIPKGSRASSQTVFCGSLEDMIRPLKVTVVQRMGLIEHRVTRFVRNLHTFIN
ncbi:unnamed protein product [Periconia digitata]|uniref:Uncharacterized protein n=1 Tax=Periconia digitata TaxID=1303443 RepID=A0A9W4U6T7_9PLEO|nr:unnamed protein product [Periconia digitata]